MPELRRLWTVQKGEFAVAAACLLGVALVGVLEGIIIAVILAILQIFANAWRPHSAVMGKPEDVQQQGDLLESSFIKDLSREQIDDFENDPLGQPAFDLICNATSRIVYDVDRFGLSRRAFPNDLTKWQPCYAATIVREIHVKIKIKIL